MSPCLYHEALSIPGGFVNTMSPCLFHESISITWVQKFKLKKYKKKHITGKTSIFCCCLNNTISWNTEIEITGIQKYKLHIYQNKNYTNAEIKIPHSSLVFHFNFPCINEDDENEYDDDYYDDGDDDVYGEDMLKMINQRGWPFDSVCCLSLAINQVRAFSLSCYKMGGTPGPRWLSSS